MNNPDLETRLKQTLAVARAPRSIVDDVMRQLPQALPTPARRFVWRHPALVASLAAPAVIAAALVFFFFSGVAVRITLADVQAAVEGQPWVHVRHDSGQIKEEWTNLRTGEWYGTRFDGGATYVNEHANTGLSYWKNAGEIRQYSPFLYLLRKAPRPWTPRTAWEQIIVPLEDAAAKGQRIKSPVLTIVSAHDTLNGRPAIRFDTFTNDALGHRFLYSQLWADPGTRLPVRVRTRLQLGERGAAGKEWSTGNYDFPTAGPTDIYALGVPRGTPIHKEVTTATADVQPILDAINHAHDGFLKNYRAIIWTVGATGIKPIDGLDIIWRDGEKLRQDHHLPVFELQSNPTPPLPTISSAALLEWAGQHEAAEKQLMDSQREYMWRSAAVARTSKPQVHVIRHDRIPLLARNAWPEQIQWPTRNMVPDFQMLEANGDTPAGCIGLLSGGQGSSRIDYYIDPTNDSVCVKQVWWTKRGTEWVKTREYTLSNLHRVAGHVVAGTQQLRDYGDPARHLVGYTQTMTIDVVPLTVADYPHVIFDPATFTTGANVEGY